MAMSKQPRRSRIIRSVTIWDDKGAFIVANNAGDPVPSPGLPVKFQPVLVSMDGGDADYVTWENNYHGAIDEFDSAEELIKYAKKAGLRVEISRR